ncbi:MAG: hypothetical protein A2550_04200, partial [Candidatus Jacksonbacteria bacterium RIFOXYD2_FULL_43_21]
MDDLKAIYNKVAVTYDEVQSQNDRWLTNQTINEFFKAVPARAKVLDLGCGPGIQAGELLKRGYQVTGIDFSEEMIKRARGNVPGARFKVVDILQLDFPPVSFDAVWAKASLLHLPKKSLLSVLAKIATILKPGGWLFINVKEGDGETIIEEDYLGLKDLKRFFALYQAEEFKE